jgi:hypothetical protein
MICEQTLEVFWRIANRKFPERISDFESFMAQASLMIEIVPVPTSRGFTKKHGLQ